MMDVLNSRPEISHAEPEDLPAMYPGVTMWHGLGFLLQHMCFDISKAQRAFGYAPTHTTEQGLAKSLEWCESADLL